MSESKTPISGASSYIEIGEYWDSHDLADHWEQAEPAEFDVSVRGSSIYFALERNLAEQLRAAVEAQECASETPGHGGGTVEVTRRRNR